MSKVPAPADVKAFRNLTVFLMENHSDVISDMKSRWELKKDNLGRPLGFVPGYDIKLNDANAYIKQLQEHPQVRIVRK